MEVDLNEQKHFCIMPFEGSKETQWVELNDYQMWMMELVIKGNTMTPKGKKVLWKYSVVFCEPVENNLWSTNWNMGGESLQYRKNTANN